MQENQYLFDLVEKLRCLMEQTVDPAILENRWVPLAGGYQPRAEPEQCFDLADNIFNDFVGHPDRDVLLLIGQSGSGKTWFGQHLAVQLWQSWQLGQPIPLWVPLLSIEKPSKALLDQHLKQLQKTSSDLPEEMHITKKEISAFLKEQPPLLLVLDGYDEIPINFRQENFFRSNQWGKWKGGIQTIYTSRPEALPENPKAIFGSGRSGNYIERHLQLFDESQIEQFVDVFLSNPNYEPQENWDGNRYLTVLQETPELKEFIGKPFLLKMVLQAWPSIMEEVEQEFQENQLLQRQKLTRQKLYQKFLEQHYARETQRLEDMGKRLEIEQAAYDENLEEQLTLSELLEAWTQNFARACFARHVNSVRWIPPKKGQFSFQIVQAISSFFQPISSKNANETSENPEWLNPFFNDQQYPRLGDLRSGCPIIRVGPQEYAFLHLSILEYYAAKHLFNGALKDAWALTGHNLNAENFQEKPEILQFLVDRVVEENGLPEEEQIFTNTLWAILEQSKYEPSVWEAAANAITILNYGGISFSGKDLRRVRIGGIDKTTGKNWGADLSYGLFDHANFSDSDLRYVKFLRTCLRNVNWSRACLDDAEFGERPGLAGGCRVVLSKDGKRLVVLSYLTGLITKQHTVTVYDWYSQQQQKQQWTIYGEVWGFALSPDGNYIATGSKEGTVFCWELETGKCLWQQLGDSEWIKAITFSSDSNWIASASYGKTIRLWEVKTAECISKLHYNANSFAFSPDGLWFAVGSSDYLICLSVKTWQVQWEGEIYINCKVLTFSPDSQWLASGDLRGLKLWNATSGECMWANNEQEKSLEDLAFSLDSRWLTSAASDNVIRFWDVERGHCVAAESQSGSVKEIIYHPTDPILIVSTWKQINCLTQFYGASALEKITPRVLSLDENTLVLWPSSNYSVFWEYRDVIVLRDRNTYLATRFIGHTSRVCSIAFSPDGRWLASSDNDGNIRLWEIQTAQCLWVGRGHTKRVGSLVFSPDGQSLALDSHNFDKGGAVSLWSVETGQCLWKTEKHRGYVRHLIFSPNGCWLAANTANTATLLKKSFEPIYVWNVENGQTQCVIEDDIPWIRALVFSPDGQWLASGSDDYAIRLWDVESDQCQWIGRHSYYIGKLAFSPDSTWLASTSYGAKNIRLWEIKTGAYRYLSKCSKKVDTFTFSPNGQWLAANAQDNTFYLWDVFSGQLLTSTFLGLNICVILEESEIQWGNDCRYLAISCENGYLVLCIPQNPQTQLIQIVRCSNSLKQLVTTALNLAHVTGLSDRNQRLLEQRSQLDNKATLIGQPDKRASEQVLQERNSQVYIPEGFYTQSWGSDTFHITSNRWVVGIVRKKNSKQESKIGSTSGDNDHVWLILQGLDENHYTIIQEIHLFLNEEAPTQLSGAIGQGLIQIRHCSPYDLSAKTEELCVKFWSISQDDSECLLTNVRADQIQGVNYWIGGRSPDFFKAPSYNCLSWCEKHLRGIGIEPKEHPQFLDYFFAIPTRYLPSTTQNEPETKSACLVM